MKVEVLQNIRLNNGKEIPAVGLGTWQLRGSQAEEAVAEALKAGYRHIDTASMYGNEEVVGRAVKNSGIDREELFIATKLAPHDMEDPRRALESSLQRLGMGYVDLYLIHWPTNGPHADVWLQMEEFYGEGLCHSIGVSNFSADQLYRLMEGAAQKPAVNQIEVSPFGFPADIIEFCQGNDIAVEAYSPLTKGRRLDEGPISELAAKYGKSPAQILIRWDLQHGMVTLPKSGDPQHMRENLDVFNFDISAEDMSRLDALDEGYSAL